MASLEYEKLGKVVRDEFVSQNKLVEIIEQMREIGPELPIEVEARFNYKNDQEVIKEYPIILITESEINGLDYITADKKYCYTAVCYYDKREDKERLSESFESLLEIVDKVRRIGYNLYWFKVDFKHDQEDYQCYSELDIKPKRVSLKMIDSIKEGKGKALLNWFENMGTTKFGQEPMKYGNEMVIKL